MKYEKKNVLIPPRIFFGKNEKIKVVPNWMKWRENWSETISGFFDRINFLNFRPPTPPSPHPPGDNKKRSNEKIKVVPNWPKWLEK